MAVFFCRQYPGYAVSGEFRHRFIGGLYETNDPDRIRDLKLNGGFGKIFVLLSDEKKEVKPSTKITEPSYLELKAQAKVLGIVGLKKLKKPELIAAIEKVTKEE